MSNNPIEDARRAYRLALQDRRAVLVAELSALDREIAAVAGVLPGIAPKAVRRAINPRTSPRANPDNGDLLAALALVFNGDLNLRLTNEDLHARIAAVGCAFQGVNPPDAMRSRIKDFPGSPYLNKRYEGWRINPDYRPTTTVHAGVGVKQHADLLLGQGK